MILTPNFKKEDFNYNSIQSLFVKKIYYKIVTHLLRIIMLQRNKL